MINADQLQGRWEINLEQFPAIMAHYKIKKQNQDTELAIDVFMSLGGNQDCSNEIQANKLLSVMKNFDLTINIEDLVKEIDDNQNGLLDFNEFRHII